MDRILIIGAKGLVGTAITKLLPNAVAWDRENLDVTNFPSIHAKFPELNGKVDAVINCVAFNDVDGAEKNPEMAEMLNAKVPKQLALFANALRVPLVHFSTGYVFDGKSESYKEDDIPNPLSVYGSSKLAGEKLVEEQGGRFYIVRTNVVFGPAGTSELSKKSFVDKVLEVADKNKDLSFVEDEVNSVTYAPDLAKAVIDMVTSKAPYGTYHGVNEGKASWFEFAQEILKDRTDVTISPIPGSSLERAAARPHFAVLENTRLPKFRNWQEALNEYLQR